MGFDDDGGDLMAKIKGAKDEDDQWGHLDSGADQYKSTYNVGAAEPTKGDRWGHLGDKAADATYDVEQGPAQPKSSVAGAKIKAMLQSMGPALKDQQEARQQQQHEQLLAANQAAAAPRRAAQMQQGAGMNITAPISVGNPNQQAQDYFDKAKLRSLRQSSR